MTAPSEPSRHQQRPSLISLFTGQHSSSHLSSSYHMDCRQMEALKSSNRESDHRTISRIVHFADYKFYSHLFHSKTDAPGSAFSKETISETQSPDGITTNSINAGDGSSTIVMPSTGSSSETTIVPHLTHSMSLQRQSSWKIQTPRLRFVSSVEFKHSSGETSTTPLSPESPNSPNSSGDNNNKPSRLQRSKASSRKTFRSRRGRHYNLEVRYQPIVKL